MHNIIHRTGSQFQIMCTRFDPWQVQRKLQKILGPLYRVILSVTRKVYDKGVDKGLIPKGE